MTYCVGMLLDAGLVMISDSRTSAGVDDIATYRKMSIWAVEGERVMVVLTAGNLAVTQAVLNLLSEGVDNGAETPETMYTVPSMFGAARLAGRALREVYRVDGPALKEHGAEFNASLILGGQIRDRTMRLFHIYSAGNFIEATSDTPFVQIGESKYGKPILDRALTPRTSLIHAVKLGLLSMDSTMRSNLSVGPPIDVVVYEKDSLALKLQHRIDEDDAYFTEMSKRWSRALKEAYQQLPDPDW